METLLVDKRPSVRIWITHDRNLDSQIKDIEDRIKRAANAAYIGTGILIILVFTERAVSSINPMLAFSGINPSHIPCFVTSVTNEWKQALAEASSIEA